MKLNHLIWRVTSTLHPSVERRISFFWLLADYSIACSLPLVAVTDYTLTPEMQAYFDRFKAASLSYEECVAPLQGFLASQKS